MSLKIHYRPSLSFIVFFLGCFFLQTLGAQWVQLEEEENQGYLGSKLQYLVDEEGKINPSNVSEQTFNSSSDPVLNLEFNKRPIWLRATFKNDSEVRDYLLNYSFPMVDSLWVYESNSGELKLRILTGASFNQSSRLVDHQNYLIPFNFQANENEKEIYLKIKSNGQLIIPLSVNTVEGSISSLTAADYFKGIFYGILIAMILYNLVISFFIKDRSYYFYVGYIASVTISQAILDGYMQRYVLGDWPYILHVLVILAPSLGGFFALYFAQVFLQVRNYSSRLYKGILALQVFYLSIALLSFFPNLTFLYRLVDIAALLVSVYSLIVSSIIAKTGSRPAKFFLIAFGFLLLSLIVFVFRNIGVLPYGFFTNNAIQLGFSIQVVLLSIALADRINTLRKEKEASQEEALLAAQENQKLIKEQNILLEQRVQERTVELEESNEELRVTLDNLKETQTQLVDAEKMASLGQLTAGIAHEINNPINFVTSNISPLRRDLEDIYEILDLYCSVESGNDEQLKQAKDLAEEMEYDYLKTEINSLVNGISDGANRTSEIVKGLRTFSRLDEDVVKQAGLHENLESTLVLLNNKVKDGIEVVREFDEAIAEIECYPGKLNQVFMNILNNSIYAVEHKNYSENEKPIITLKTQREGSEVVVTISDNGIGMSAETQRKIFDPFFTTKEVGEGTGLGMSIVFKIIQKHNGSIELNSTEGVGTDFIIHLPVTQPSEF